MRRVSGMAVLEAGLWSVLAGLVGARAYYVLVNRAYFAESPSAIWRLWDGGFSFPGGLIAGAAAVWAFARSRRLSSPSLADAFAPGLAAAMALGWAANLLAGNAYGRPGRGFGTMFLPDIYGVFEQRMATQLFGVVASVIILIAVYIVITRTNRPGWALTTWLGGWSLAQVGLEFTRGDDTLMLGSLRLGHVIGFVALAATLALVARLILRPAEPTEAKEHPVEETALGRQRA